MNENNMLDHQKLVIKNSVHDVAMFQKELLKSLKWLKPEDLNELYVWLKANYWATHRQIIETAFNEIAA